MTLTGSLSRAMAIIAPNTVAAPAMSHFMVSMPSVGLIDSPPLSKVTPLPTKASRGLSFAGRRRIPGRPAAAAARSPGRRPAGRPFAPASASFVEDAAVESEVLCELFGPLGEAFRINVLAGRLTSSRTTFIASPRIWPRRAAASTCAPLAARATTIARFSIGNRDGSAL